MVSRTIDTSRTRLFSPGVRDFLRRRALELGGGVLAAASLWLAAALATYHSGDSSFNTAAAAPTANLGGAAGAGIADLMVQSVGIAAILFVVAPLAWSWPLMCGRRLSSPAWRLLSLAAAALLLPIAVAALPFPTIPRLPAGWGGALGDLFLGGLATAVPTDNGRRLAVALVAGVLGTACLVPAAGTWRATIRLLHRGGQHLGHHLRRFSVSCSHRLAALVGTWRNRDAGVKISRWDAYERMEPRLEQAGETPPPTGEAATRSAAGGHPKITLPPSRRRKLSGGALDLNPAGGGQLPPLNLLKLPPDDAVDPSISKEALSENARQLESVLDDFGVTGEIVKVRPGPVVTLYELEPAPGTKASRVVNLADDVARSMSAVSVRIAVIPGRSVIGIELPNQRRETVFLRELLSSKEYESTTARLTLGLGKDIGGAPVIVDLARMPHLLVAGTTGSGKSVAVNSMILSLLYRLPPDQCKLILIDPKMLELSVYDGIPHLLAPVVTEPDKAVVALKWTVREMEARYRAMSGLGVRSIEGYNTRLAEAVAAGETLTRRVQTGFDADSGEPVYEEQQLPMERLPLIVVVVDEMADLMLVAGKEIEGAIQRLAQMARAAGIHLIMATQRPSVDVITGTIKANFPTRISFQVTSKIDSRTILGEQGAEQLLGQGDMLYMVGGGRIKRVHGPFVSDREVERITDFLRKQGTPEYVDTVTEHDEFNPAGLDGGAPRDGENDLYDQAVAIVCREGKASTSFIQRHLQIGYNRAARIIERMEAEGVVSRANHVGKREVLALDTESRF